jgi:phosphoglycolate phosphatase
MRDTISGATVVFDLDGTIADTAADLVPAANAALIAEGFPPAEEHAILQGVGYGTKAMLRSALSSLDLEVGAEQMQRMADRLVAHYESNIACRTTLFPGFLGAADFLLRQGAKLALCTNKRERLAVKLVSALGVRHMFDALAGGDTFPFHKPDPRHVTELVVLAGGVASRSIMVGDSEADVAAARAAGIPVIAVSFGYAAGRPDELGADAVLDHFDDLPSLLKRFPALQERG